MFALTTLRGCGCMTLLRSGYEPFKILPNVIGLRLAGRIELGAEGLPKPQKYVT